MKYFMIIGIWLAVLIGDGVILPALTGLPAGFGIIVFLSALVITFGIHRWVIGLGIILAGVTELMIGAYFGVIMGAWLVMAWSWHLLNKFLNMKPLNESDSLVALMPFTLLGLGLFALGESALWAISRFIYEAGLTAMVLVDILRSPAIFSIVAAELVITLFIFHFIYSPRNSIYG